MDNRQITKMLSHVPDFIGVFSCNNLPKTFPISFALVVNTDPDYKSGRHWQAVVVRDNIAHFFCSFGGPPRVQSIKQFCDNFPLIFYNQKKHQKLNEETCGAYCIYVINEMASGRSFNSILDTFNRIKRDDLFVRNYLSRHFNFSL